GVADTSVIVGSAFAAAVPPFVAGIGLVAAFAVALPWFPTFGAGDGMLSSLWHLTLPALALALPAVGLTARMTRAGVREALRQDHVQTAEIRGLPRSYIVRHHVMRNSLVPVITATGLSCAGMITGAVVVE